MFLIVQTDCFVFLRVIFPLIKFSRWYIIKLEILNLLLNTDERYFMFHNKSIFKKYVLTYCVVIFIPTLLVFGLCLFQYVTAKHTIEKQYETSLSQTQSSVDQYFEEIDNIVHQLLLNPTAIMYFSSQSNNIVAYDAHSVLSLYSFSNPLIDNIILYNRHDDRITDFSTTFNLSDSYSDTISVGNYTYEQFTNNFLNVKNYQKLYPCQNLKYYDRASNVL